MPEAAPGAGALPSARKALVWSLLVVAAFAVGAAAWVRDLPADEDEEIGVQWSNAIRRLGIEPIYPPQEDISVGDVSLVIAADRLHPEEPPTFEALNSIKLWRLDLSEDLKRYYSYVPIFPDTLPRTDNPNEVWKQVESAESVFATDVVRKTLPIVLFPEFSLAKVRQSTNRFSGLGGVVSGVFGGGAESERTIEIKIPAAETYGVPAIVAFARLSDFCNAEKTRPFCTQAGARAQLATVAGRAIFACLPADKDGRPRGYRYEVQIYLTSRVYMIRSIETIVGTGSALRESAAVTTPADPAQADSGSSEGKAASGTPAGAEAGSSLLDEERRRLARIGDSALGLAPGSNVSIAAADAQRIAISKTLQRPVAIGYRAYKTDLFEEDASCAGP